MLIKQHQSNTISLSSVIELENGMLCLTPRVEVKLSINTLRPHVSVFFFNPQLRIFFYPVTWQDRAQFFTVTGRARCKPRALYDACPVAIFPKGSWVLKWILIRVGYIWFEYGYVWSGNFWIRKEKVADCKLIRLVALLNLSEILLESRIRTRH